LPLECHMRKITEIFSEDKGLKEQVGCRVESSVKKILEEIAKKEFRTVANVTEKLICERLRDLGFLDKDFEPIEGKPTKR
jgi:hypothetical protein